MGLTHINEKGEARMVNVGDKPYTLREAVAAATVKMQPDTLAAIAKGEIAKGDVFATARIAGIMAAKNTSTLIPLCHPLPIDGVDVVLEQLPPDRVGIRATVRTTYKTGVEMEALTAASVAALTIYDMCKAIDRGMEITGVCLLKKQGGKSGTYTRGDEHD